MKLPAIIFIMLFANLSSASAAELGRLFFTPQQRTQLETQQEIGESGEGGKRSYIVVNGLIQRQNGTRIVWINGEQQPAVNGGENLPSTVPVNVPGRSQPVPLKIGQKLLLEAPPQEENK
jgi:hypothetical protein